MTGRSSYVSARGPLLHRGPLALSGSRDLVTVKEFLRHDARWAWWEAILLAVLIGLTYFLYRAALGAGFQFDDVPNLKGLEDVTDLPSTILFSLQGEAGPLGRPIALLTFALQAASWPEHPEDFLRVNILIHLLNGSLVALLAARIALLFPSRVPRPGLLGMLVAGLWLLAPLLASTSLMVIQRMTSLSATGALLGLLLYVAGRTRVDRSPKVALSLMSLGVVGGTTLATLTKETGALVPLYVWVLEGTLIAAAGLPRPRVLRAWKAAFLAVPALLLVAYVLWSWQGIVASYAAKPFDLTERVATQTVILWQYVRQLVAPNLFALGPFHDGYAALAPTDLRVVAATAGWLLMLALAIRSRRRLPLLSFAIGWFLVGHLLESTVFSLELYFEHRNYLPSLGPVTLLAAVPLAVPADLRRASWAALAAYAVLIAWVLLQLTSLWGQPRLAAEIWAMHNPGSSRATQFLGQHLLREGSHGAALALFQSASERNPHASDLALQTLQMACGHVDSTEYKIRLDEVVTRLQYQHHSYGTIDALHRLGNMAIDEECLDVTPTVLITVAEALLDNPAFRSNLRSRHHLHHEIARLAHFNGDKESAIAHLRLAFDASPNPETAAMLAATQASAGLTEDAIATLDTTERFAPANSVLRARWDKLLGEVRGAIERGRRGVGPHT